jgi:hypothetical protein
MLGMMMVLGAFGIGTKAYAYQEIPPLPSGLFHSLFFTLNKVKDS